MFGTSNDDCRYLSCLRWRSRLNGLCSRTNFLSDGLHQEGHTWNIEGFLCCQGTCCNGSSQTRPITPETRGGQVIGLDKHFAGA
jgi:hypothetical protein